MGNEGILQIELFDVAGSPARDPKTGISVKRVADNRVIKRVSTSFPPARRLRLPAFPQERELVAFIESTRFRSRYVEPFTLTHDTPVVRDAKVFRRPAQWRARWLPWEALGRRFSPLKAVLNRSAKLKIKGGKTYKLFTGSTYDGIAVSDARALLAKVALLNLFTKMTLVIEPIHNRKPWFEFVDRIIAIGRERFIAVVDKDMVARAKKIREKISDFKGTYKRTPVGDHYKNMPAAWKVTKKSMFSIKTHESVGNLQLTFGAGLDPDTGKPVHLLDVDIDENGKLMAHLGDLFKHKVSGGTHPYDIHEYLQLAYKKVELGYELI